MNYRRVNLRVLLSAVAIMLMGGFARPFPSPLPVDTHPGRRLERVAFLNVNVVRPEKGTIDYRQTVYIENGKIRSIEDGRSAAVPAGTHRIEAQGKYLIPGLADMHIHHQSMTGFEQAYGDNDLLLFLANGVTTVRNMAGSELDLKTKARIAAGEILGPHYYSCGPQLSLFTIKTAEQARAAVTDQHKAGYDFIKIYSVFPEAALQKAIETANQLGMPAVGHAQVHLPIDAALKLKSIEHLEEFLAYFKYEPPDHTKHAEIVKKIVSHKTVITPTLVGLALHSYLDKQERQLLFNRPEARYVAPKWYRFAQDENNEMYKNLGQVGYAKLKRDYELALQYAKYLHDNGVPLLLGTDATLMLVPGFSVHDELTLMVKAGLTPAAALRTATTNVAEFMGSSEARGSVSVNKEADLVLLDGDPLADIANTKKIQGVMIGRHWLDKTAIDTILIKLQKR